jgi:hypothetical protein
MKLKACSLVASLFLALSGTAFSADIPISGPEIVYGLHNYTYYAYPPTPITPGTTYTWEVGATIVAQNTDPAAGPLYITVQWEPVLMEDYVQISDDHGNAGSLWIQVWGWGYARSVLLNPFGAGYSYRLKA